MQPAWGCRKHPDVGAPRVGELPFDSERKLMSTFHKERGRTDVTQFTKGAPDVLLGRCTHWLRDGLPVP